jgi:hypothetical protein
MRWTLLAASLPSLLALVAFAGHAGASGPAPTPFTMTVTPPRFTVPYTPGQTVTRSVEISNPGSTSLHIDALLSEFSQSRDGSMRFSSPSPASAGWVTVTPAHADVAPHATQTMAVSITVPATADAGERQIGVILRVPPAPGEGNITVTAGVGVEILAGTPGAVTEKTALDRLDAPGFSAGGPIPLTLTLTEQGNVHREFVAPHQLVADVSGGTVALPDFIVLKGVTRTVTTSWDSPPAICICTARVTTGDGQGHRITVSKTIVIFPVRTALGIVALLTGLVLLTLFRRRSRRAGRRAQLEQVRREAYELARRELDAQRPGAMDVTAAGPTPDASG